MKIQSLHIRNLNSLVGDWAIDFSQPLYEETGFFAITGPTGAGKSTILDAICLALYGKTPRLNRISKSANDIMSTNSGNCLAEVVFSTEKGRFRSKWTQKKAHNKPDGEFQVPERELSNADTNEIIGTKSKDVGSLIEEYTGMDFERFTRTMMLAQGSFTAFLLAPVQERSNILEEITGTEIYSEISRMVFERSREEDIKVKTLQDKLQNLKNLTPEDIDLIRTEIDGLTRQVRISESEVTTIQSCIHWLTLLDNLRSDLSKLEENHERSRENYDAFSEKRVLLESADRARQIESRFTLLNNHRKEYEDYRSRIEEAKKRLPSLREEHQKAITEEETLRKTLRETRTLQEEDARIARDVRVFDSLISVKREESEKYRKRIEGLESFLLTIREEILKNETQYQKSELEYQKADAYIRDHEADAGLSEAYSGIDLQYNEYEKLVKELEKKGKDLAELTEKEKNSSQGIGNIKKEYQDIEEVITRITGQISGRESVIREGLSDLSVEEMNDSIQSLTIRTNAIRDLDRLVMELLQRLAKYSELEGFILQNNAQIQKNEQDLAVLKEKESLIAELEATLEDQFRLASRVLSAEEIRKGLVDGQPCPACGSTHHPYAEGNIPDIGAIESALKTRRVELSEIRKITASLLQAIATASSKNEVHAEERESLASEIEKNRVLVDESSAGLSISLPDEDKETVTESALSECSGRLEQMKRVKNLVDPLIRQNESDRSAVEKHQKDLLALNERRVATQNEQTRITSDLRNCNEEMRRITADLKTREEDLYSVVSIYGFSRDSGPGFVVKTLRDRKDVYATHKSASDRLSREINRLLTEITNGRDRLAEKEEEKNTQIKEASTIDEELTLIRQNREELYGDKNPDKEEKRYHALISDLTENIDSATRRREEKSGTEKDLEAKIVHLEDTLRSVDQKREEAGHEFSTGMIETGFSSEEEYKDALLPAEIYQDLSETEERLKRDLITTTARVEEKQRELSAHKEKGLTSEPVDTLNEELILKKQSIQALNEEIFKRQKVISDHQDQEEAAIRLKQEISGQKKEQVRWGRLNQMIGSKEGNKFRSFAQGLTLSLLLNYANDHLQKLTDRYSLTTKKDSPLEIHVIDHYRAGEVRVAQNLSGGESFIVSLALALGLSAMSSKNVRVDSLFLDEGFGTLDEDALDTALSTLSHMRQEGKLIGVISHVQALKERIPVQILVEKGPGGRSRISGPGCTRV